MARWVADNEVEKEFEKLVAKNRKLYELWNEVKALSDDTGLPVGPYVPQNYNEDFASECDEKFVRELTGATGDLWYHSQAVC